MPITKVGEKNILASIIAIAAWMMLSPSVNANETTYLVPMEVDSQARGVDIAITLKGTLIDFQFDSGSYVEGPNLSDPYNALLSVLTSYVQNNESLYLAASVSDPTDSDAVDQAKKAFSLYRQAGYAQATAITINRSFQIGKSTYYDVLLVLPGGATKRDLLLIVPRENSFRHARDKMMEIVPLLIYKILEHERTFNTSLQVSLGERAFASHITIHDPLGIGSDENDPVLHVNYLIPHDGAILFAGSSGLEFQDIQINPSEPLYGEISFFRETWRLLSQVPETEGYQNSVEYGQFADRLDQKSRQNVLGRLRDRAASIIAFKQSWLKNLRIVAVVNADPLFFFLISHSRPENDSPPLAINVLIRNSDGTRKLTNLGSKTLLDGLLVHPGVSSEFLGGGQE